MRVDAAVIQRLMNHCRVRRHDARGDKPEWRPRIFVEAGEVDRGLDRIVARIDDCNGI